MARGGLFRQAAWPCYSAAPPGSHRGPARGRRYTAGLRERGAPSPPRFQPGTPRVPPWAPAQGGGFSSGSRRRGRRERLREDQLRAARGEGVAPRPARAAGEALWLAGAARPGAPRVSLSTAAGRGRPGHRRMHSCSCISHPVVMRSLPETQAPAGSGVGVSAVSGEPRAAGSERPGPRTEERHRGCTAGSSTQPSGRRSRRLWQCGPRGLSPWQPPVSAGLHVTGLRL